MLTIIDGGSLTRALTMPIDPRLRRLLSERRDQLGGDIASEVRFVIVQPGDTLDALERELGFPVLGDPEGSFGCEWVEDHGTFYEALWILTDDGYAHVAFITKLGPDPDLLKFCEMHITAPV